MIKVIAKNYLKENKTDEALKLFENLIEFTLREEGCIKYELYQNKKIKSTFIILEEWENMDMLNKHMSSKFFKEIILKMKECINKQSSINICEKLFKNLKKKTLQED